MTALARTAPSPEPLMLSRLSSRTCPKLLVSRSACLRCSRSRPLPSLLSFSACSVVPTSLLELEQADPVVVGVDEPGGQGEAEVGDALHGAQLGEVLDRDTALVEVGDHPRQGRP